MKRNNSQLERDVFYLVGDDLSMLAIECVQIYNQGPS